MGYLDTMCCYYLPGFCLLRLPLKAQWTPEFAQDLNAYHSIDAEAELTSILSEYISMEIDLEILDMLINNADTVEGWSAKVANDVSS